MIWVKWIYDHCSCNCNLRSCEVARKKKEKRFGVGGQGALMGFRPVESVFALQCSTSWAMKTYTWRAGQLSYEVESRPWVQILLSPKKLFLWASSQLLKMGLQRWLSHLHFIYISKVCIISILYMIWLTTQYKFLCFENHKISYTTQHMFTLGNFWTFLFLCFQLILSKAQFASLTLIWGMSYFHQNLSHGTYHTWMLSV